MITLIVSEIDSELDQRYMLCLYEAHKELMFKISGKYVFESNYVEDVVQEALLYLCRNLSTLKQLDRYQLQVYIVYTVKHAAYRHNSRMKRDKQHLIFDEDNSLIQRLGTGERVLEDEFAKKEKVVEIRSVLKKLAEDDQDIIIRKYYLKQNDREIAEAHGLMASSVRMRLTRIRRRFLKLMNEEGLTYEIT